MITYRITCTNNADARHFKLLDRFTSTVRHNGGKVVVALVDDDERVPVEAILDASHQVASYETEQHGS